MKMKIKDFFTLRTILAKIIITVLVLCIVIIVFMRNSVSSAMTQLEEQLIADRLTSDIKYIKDLIGSSDDDWNVRGESIYLGDVCVGDATNENANLDPFLEHMDKTGTFSYVFKLTGDEGLGYVEATETSAGYHEGHYIRIAGSTLSPEGNSIVGTYIQKEVADELDAKGFYSGEANVAGGKIFCLYETLLDKDGKIVGAVVVGRNISELKEIIKSSIRNMTLVLIGCFALLSIVLITVTVKISASANKIIGYVKRIEMDDIPEENLLVKSRDELESIANSINSMVVSVKENAVLQNKIKDLAENMQKTSNEVKCNINDLSNASVDSDLVFEKIAKGNISNADSVAVQTDMTMKITGLIEKVVNDTNSAKVSTNESINGLNESRVSLQDLKNKSLEIIDTNKNLMDAINEFVRNTGDVKRITAGITDISDQTNLLSLNASIESARAGEVGKGFAIVAEEIRKLSEETANLTNNIENIIGNLEEGAIKAQHLIDEVESSIEEENKTIDKTMDKFGVMEKDMIELRSEMENILASTSDVVNYNSSIKEHIEQLSSETKEVTLHIEEAMTINRTNKLKTNETKEVMEKLNEVVEELVRE